MTARSGHLTLRKVPGDVRRGLDREKRRRGQSLNRTAIELLHAALGLATGRTPNNGLERFAGTWSESEHAEFEAAMSCFERIDDEHWR